MVEKRKLGIPGLVSSPLAFRNALYWIRPIRAEDLPTLFNWRSDSVVSEYLAGEAPESMAQQMRWYESYLNNDASLYFMAFQHSEDAGPIAYCQVFNVNRRDVSAEYGVVLGNSDRFGSGQGLKLTLAFNAIMFDCMGFNTVYANINPDNSRAISVVHRFLGSEVVSGEHPYSKCGEQLYKLDKRDFARLKASLLHKSASWARVLDVECIEQTDRGFE